MIILGVGQIRFESRSVVVLLKAQKYTSPFSDTAGEAALNGSLGGRK